MSPLHLEPWMIGIGFVACFFLFLFGVGLLVKRFYQKCSADEALVRTGMGGTRVIIGGGMAGASAAYFLATSLVPASSGLPGVASAVPETPLPVGLQFLRKY